MKAFLTVLVFASLTLATRAAEPAATTPEKLVIGTWEAPPFAMKDDTGAWSGIAVDLWRDVAARLQLDYVLREMGEPETLITGVADQSLDASMAAITVTADCARRILLELREEIQSFYRDCRVTRELIELRNAVQTALLVVHAASLNPVSKGCHYIVDSE